MFLILILLSLFQEQESQQMEGIVRDRVLSSITERQGIFDGKFRELFSFRDIVNGRFSDFSSRFETVGSRIDQIANRLELGVNERTGLMSRLDSVLDRLDSSERERIGLAERVRQFSEENRVLGDRLREAQRNFVAMKSEFRNAIENAKSERVTIRERLRGFILKIAFTIGIVVFLGFVAIGIYARATRKVATFAILVLLLPATSAFAQEYVTDSDNWNWSEPAEHHRAIVGIASRKGTGCGVVVRKLKPHPRGGSYGIVLTAHHVIEPFIDGPDFRIQFCNGRRARGCRVINFRHEPTYCDIAAVYSWVPDDIPAVELGDEITLGQLSELCGLGGSML